MGNILDLKGETFGRLKVLKIVNRRTNSGGAIWLCKCSCGVKKEISSNTLKQGSALSCGCLKKKKFLDMEIL